MLAVAVNLPPESLAAAQKLLLLPGGCNLRAPCRAGKGCPLASPVTWKVTCMTLQRQLDWPLRRSCRVQGRGWGVAGAMLLPGRLGLQFWGPGLKRERN